MASTWEKLGQRMIRGARETLDWLVSDDWMPEVGEGSKHDYAYESRHYVGGDELSGRLPKNRPGPFADAIVQSAYANIGEDILTLDKEGKATPNWVCAAGVCDIVEDIMPWPEDERGVKSVYNPYIQDAFEGKGEAGRLFEYSEDFRSIETPNDLAKGDIMLLNTGPNPRSGTHAVVVTGVYGDKVEIVHEQGAYNPVGSKTYDREWLDGSFRKAYRYMPSSENWAVFNEMNIKGG